MRTSDLPMRIRAGEILDVHDALEALANESPVKAELVKLRNFGGLSHQKAADSLGLSRDGEPLLSLRQGIGGRISSMLVKLFPFVV